MSKATGIKGYTPDRLRRKEDAEKRQADREARTAHEQLLLLDAREGESRQETRRLERQQDADAEKRFGAHE